MDDGEDKIRDLIEDQNLIHDLPKIHIWSTVKHVEAITKVSYTYADH